MFSTSYTLHACTPRTSQKIEAALKNTESATDAPGASCVVSVRENCEPPALRELRVRVRTCVALRAKHSAASLQ